eukprot:10508287-Alexandrium_andersonii.AAC.1
MAAEVLRSLQASGPRKVLGSAEALPNGCERGGAERGDQLQRKVWWHVVLAVPKGLRIGVREIVAPFLEESGKAART